MQCFSLYGLRDSINGFLFVSICHHGIRPLPELNIAEFRVCPFQALNFSKKRGKRRGPGKTFIKREKMQIIRKIWERSPAKKIEASPTEASPKVARSLDQGLFISYTTLALLSLLQSIGAARRLTGYPGTRLHINRHPPIPGWLRSCSHETHI